MLIRTLSLALVIAGSGIGSAELPLAASGPAGIRSPRAGAAADTARVEARAEVKRFFQVDDRFYRGGQPDEDGFRALRDLGIDTIISLRTGDGEEERTLVESLGMRFVRIPVRMLPFGLNGSVPEEAVARFLEIVDDPSYGPVFVHCRRGADRTGTFVGLYRIARQGWESEDAYDEAREIGMRWWYFSVKGYLEDFAEDLEETRATHALSPSGASGERALPQHR